MNPRLAETFNLLKNHCPALAMGTPLSRGAFGIVIDHGDDTVSKVLLRQNTPHRQAESEEMLRNEHYFLTLLNGHPLGNVCVPELRSDITSLNDDAFFATFRMTKLPGQAPDWRALLKDGAPEIQRRHFNQLGQLAAQFQKYAAAFPVKKPAIGWMGWCDTIAHNKDLEAEAIQFLRISNDYLQANKRPAVIYGDYHPGNIKVDSDYRITGLCDFGLSGEWNSVAEFRWFLPDVNDSYPEALPWVVEGYEQESGSTVDSRMLQIASLSACADILKYKWHDPEKRQFHTEKLRRHMCESIFSGVNPPALLSPSPPAASM